MKESNKLLAEFLELSVIEFHGNLYIATEDYFDLIDNVRFNPRLDWNDLMQVIEKIKDNSEDDDYREIIINIPNISKTYEACVKFVNKYFN